MPREKKFQIGQTLVAPGETKRINLFVSKLFDYTGIDMPIKVIRGKESGPRLLVCSALHGDELNGVEIIKRLLKHSSLKKIKGTLVVVPIVNVFGFNMLSRYLPDRRDMNRCFPGTETGPLASRLAHLFLNEVVGKCTHGIDLHTGAIHRTNLPQIRACLSNREIRRMADAFGVPVILDAALIEGSLRMECSKRKIPLLVFEGGEALRYNDLAIQSGLHGILSVMRDLGMLPKLKDKKRTFKSIVAKASHWVRAPHGGIFINKAKLGSMLKVGDLLGVVSDPLGNENIRIETKKAGVIIGHTQLPLVNRGDALFHIATFHKSAQVGKSLEAFDDRFDYEER